MIRLRVIAEYEFSEESGPDTVRQKFNAAVAHIIPNSFGIPGNGRMRQRRSA